MPRPGTPTTARVRPSSPAPRGSRSGASPRLSKSNADCTRRGVVRPRRRCQVARSKQTRACRATQPVSAGDGLVTSQDPSDVPAEPFFVRGRCASGFDGPASALRTMGSARNRRCRSCRGSRCVGTTSRIGTFRHAVTRVLRKACGPAAGATSLFGERSRDSGAQYERGATHRRRNRRHDAPSGSRIAMMEAFAVREDCRWPPKPGVSKTSPI